MVDFLTRQLELEAALLDGDETPRRRRSSASARWRTASHERFAPEED
jgi:hypothetical protein